MVNNHNDSESLPELINAYTIMKLIDQMHNHLREMLGMSKIVLSYVVRDDPISPVPLPPLQPNLICSFEKSSTTDELIAYTPNTGPSYEADNAQVYNVFSKALAETNDMTSITRHQKWRDKRSAYLDLVTPNMSS